MFDSWPEKEVKASPGPEPGPDLSLGLGSFPWDFASRFLSLPSSGLLLEELVTS